MTYTVCKRLIENKTFTEESKSDMLIKMDVFLLHDRINQNEYDELVQLLDTKVLKELD